jgi:hypothetical protein
LVNNRRSVSLSALRTFTQSPGSPDTPGRYCVITLLVGPRRKEDLEKKIRVPAF